MIRAFRSVLVIVLVCSVALATGQAAHAQALPPKPAPTAPGGQPPAPAPTPVPDQNPAEPIEIEETVVVSATRSDRRLQDEPLRVEVIGREEIEEKALMIPAASRCCWAKRPACGCR